MKTLIARVGDAQHARFRAEAKRRGVTVETLLRDAVSAHVGVDLGETPEPPKRAGGGLIWYALAGALLAVGVFGVGRLFTGREPVEGGTPRATVVRPALPASPAVPPQASASRPVLGAERACETVFRKARLAVDGWVVWLPDGSSVDLGAFRTGMPEHHFDEIRAVLDNHGKLGRRTVLGHEIGIAC